MLGNLPLWFFIREDEGELKCEVNVCDVMKHDVIKAIYVGLV